MQTWVVKLSKLCNMRCSYCYEWNELSNPARMSPELWRRTVCAAIDYNRRRIAMGRGFDKTPVLIVLHGGEPLALPAAYLRDILAEFRRLTSDAPGLYQIALQTNLYSVPDEKLALLRQFRVGMSFSYDVVSGVRLNVVGKPTEEVVLQNLYRLRRRGIRMSGIAVLARHTVERVTEVYDFYARHGMGMRILPLFDGPDERPKEQFMVDHPTIIRALERLFRHWVTSGTRVAIRPLDLYFQAALRHMAGLQMSKVSRVLDGDSVLVVNVDGTVYRVVDAYVPELAMGNLAQQSLDDLLQSEAYAASLQRDADELDQHCRSCAYRTACSHAFVYDTRATFQYEGSCVTAWHCIQFMVKFIQEQGYTEADIKNLLNAARSSPPAHPSLGL